MSRFVVSRLVQAQPPRASRRLTVTSLDAASLLPWRRRREETAVAAEDLEQRREKFIPVTRRSLLRRLREEEGLLNWREREKLDSFASSLDSCFSQRFLATLQEAKVSETTHTHSHTHTHSVMKPAVAAELVRCNGS